MQITKYGQALCKATNDAAALARQTSGYSGATAHMKACETDTGIKVVLTGKDRNGKSIRHQAASVAGAYFKALACSGIKCAWHVDDTGRRRLVGRV